MILNKLEKLKLEVFVSDLTTDDVKQAGFRVAKVVMPEMQPLSADHNIRFLGVRRLYELPKKLDYTSRPTSEQSINPFPHPFA